jgi:hypothetical protein
MPAELEPSAPDPHAGLPWASLRDLHDMYFNTAPRRTPVLIAHEMLRALYDLQKTRWRPMTWSRQPWPPLRLLVRGRLEDGDWTLRLDTAGRPPMVWHLADVHWTRDAVVARLPD